MAVKNYYYIISSQFFMAELFVIRHLFTEPAYQDR